MQVYDRQRQQYIQTMMYLFCDKCIVRLHTEICQIFLVALRHVVMAFLQAEHAAKFSNNVLCLTGARLCLTQDIYVPNAMMSHNK